MKSQLFGWNKQQVEQYIKELKASNDQQLRNDADKISKMYTDLNAIHREMLEASQELVLIREQTKRLENIDRVTLMMQEKLIKEAEDRARDMLSSAYEEAQTHRQEVEAIRNQIKTISNEYKAMVQQIENHIGMQYLPANPPSVPEKTTSAANGRDSFKAGYNELEVMGGQSARNVISFIRPYQSGAGKLSDIDTPLNFFDNSDVKSSDVRSGDWDSSASHKPEPNKMDTNQPEFIEPPASSAISNEFSEIELNSSGSFDAPFNFQEYTKSGLNTTETAIIDTKKYEKNEKSDEGNREIAAVQESIEKVSRTGILEETPYSPAMPGDSSLVKGIDKKQSLYIIGNLAGTDLLDDDGHLIISKGNKITPEVVNQAFIAGRLIDLVVNMELPGFDES